MDHQSEENVEAMQDAPESVTLSQSIEVTDMENTEERADAVEVEAAIERL